MPGRSLQHSRVLVTGGSGFLGSRVVDTLQRHGASEIFAPRSKEFDLREKSAIQALRCG